jgi:glycosyltransferase involved in cell wall biosynthesis
MKVAYVTQPYDGVLPPRQNSIGLIVYNTALEVARAAQVRLYARRVAGAQPPEGLPFSVSFARSVSDDLVQWLAARYPRWARRLGFAERADAFLGWAGVVATDIDRAPVDIVHVMNYWGWSRRLRGRRLVLEMQSEWLSQMDRGAVGEQLVDVDAIVAVSSHVERLFRAAFPGYGGVVEVAHNGVDTELFCPAAPQAGHREGPRRVLFVGRISPEKGVHTLLQAFARVAAHCPDARLDLVGPRTELPERFLVGLSDDPLVRALHRFYREDGGCDYQGHLDALVRDAGLADRVSFHGSLPHREIIARYQSADVVVNPSLSETFGISIVEGMACGVPVVGTRVGGMLDTIVDEVGRSVAAEDPAALAEAICGILEDRPLAQAMGERGRQRAVTHFTWRARADRLLALYRRIGGDTRQAARSSEQDRGPPEAGTTRA